MTAAPDLFVTGASRSGTSLLDKLLSQHPMIEVLSQPLPQLYTGVKRQFLRAALTPIEQTFPLNDLFDSNFRPPELFTEYLCSSHLAPDWLKGILRAMSGYLGQFTRPQSPLSALIPNAPIRMAEFVAHYQAAVSNRSDVPIRGSKEVFAEEFIAGFLQAGTRVLLLVRDPRDVVASAFGKCGADHVGSGLPLLFVLRQWRKSVAFALHHAHNPKFRLLRYEDLVCDPNRQLDSVMAWLGCTCFPDSLASTELVDYSGVPWLSNSSHLPAYGISQDSIGHGQVILPKETVAAIETLCAPEMRVLGYNVEGVQCDTTGHLNNVIEPCDTPRPALEAYMWSAEALRPELQRLVGIDTGQFTGRLHLFENAFQQLARPRHRPSSWTQVVSGRASALIHDLARGARRGAYLLPANICPEVPLALARAGRVVRFIDIDPETLCMQTDAALKILQQDGADVAGVLYARTYGAMFNASGFFSQVRAVCPDALIIDDRSACRPLISLDESNGDDADVVLFSTGRAKYVDLGSGGYAFLAPGVSCPRHDLPFDPEHAKAMAEYFKASPSKPPANTLDELNARWPNWLNSRAEYASWPALRMAVAGERDRADACKAQMNAIYEQTIPRDAWLGARFNSWRFNIRVPDKPTLLANIFSTGAFASGHYRPVARLIGGPPSPVAEDLDCHVVNLFNDRHTNTAQVTQVVTLVREHLQRHAEEE